MANKKMKGDVVAIYLDTAAAGVTPAIWKMVACITTSDIDGSRDTIDVGSKCGPGQLAGQKTDTANFAGFYITDPTTDQVSMNQIATGYDDGTVHHWKYASPDEKYYREFNASITSYNENTDNNTAITFTVAMGIEGDIIRVAPTT